MTRSSRARRSAFRDRASTFEISIAPSPGGAQAEAPAFRFQFGSLRRQFRGEVRGVVCHISKDVFTLSIPIPHDLIVRAVYCYWYTVSTWGLEAVTVLSGSLVAALKRGMRSHTRAKGRKGGGCGKAAEMCASHNAAAGSGPDKIDA